MKDKHIRKEDNQNIKRVSNFAKRMELNNGYKVIRKGKKDRSNIQLKNKKVGDCFAEDLNEVDNVKELTLLEILESLSDRQERVQKMKRFYSNPKNKERLERFRKKKF
jgi:hypothetical protein